MTQRILDHVLAFIRGELQDLQIHLVGDAIAMARLQVVVGEAKVAAREHLFAITVIGKRTRLAHE